MLQRFNHQLYVFFAVDEDFLKWVFGPCHLCGDLQANLAQGAGPLYALRAIATNPRIAVDGASVL